MIVNSVRVIDGKIHVMMDNKQGVEFASVAAVQQAAQNAMKRVGIEGRIAIALVRAARARDIEGLDLTNIVRVEA